MLKILKLRVVPRAGGKAQRFRRIKVQLIGGHELWQKFVNIFLRRETNSFIGVGKHKTVKVNHERGKHIRMLCYRESLDSKVKGFLRVGGISLYPTAVQQGKRISLIAKNVPWQSHRTVGVHHYYGKPAAGGVVQALGHIQQALRRRSSKSSSPHGGCAYKG